MARVVVVVRHPNGPRVWVVGQRVHHGATASLAAVALLAKRKHRLALAAALVVLHDRRDWRVWFAREGLPASPLTSDELSGRIAT
jgi:hypothetical protein